MRDWDLVDYADRGIDNCIHTACTLNREIPHRIFSSVADTEDKLFSLVDALVLDDPNCSVASTAMAPLMVCVRAVLRTH